MPIRLLLALITAALVAVPGCTTDGTPTSQSSETGSSATTASPGTRAAPTTTGAPSDEDQIRDTVAAFQDAFNTENWDAYLALMCPTMRQRFSGSVLDGVRQTRATNGLTRATVVGVVIDGHNATATVESTSEVLGTGTVDLQLARGDDGWVICMTY